jgi:hypothetical protein
MNNNTPVNTEVLWGGGAGGTTDNRRSHVPSVFLRLLPSGKINYHHHKAAHGSKERIKRPGRPLVKRSGCHLNGRRKEQKNPSNYSDWGLRILHKKILLKTIWPHKQHPRENGGAVGSRDGVGDSVALPPQSSMTGSRSSTYVIRLAMRRSFVGIRTACISPTFDIVQMIM